MKRNSTRTKRKKPGKKTGKSIRRGYFLIISIFILTVALILSFSTLSAYHLLVNGSGQQFMIIWPSPLPAQSSLQLYTFGVQPELNSSSSAQMQDCGHNLPLTSEPQTLYGYSVGSSSATANQLALKVFYTDEWPLTLGAGTVTPMTQQPSDHVANPAVGNTAQRDGAGLPYFPAVFLTDITANPNDTSGDAQNGGTPLPPGDVYGAWKALGPVDPLQLLNGNGNTIGSGADPLPASPNGPGVGTGFWNFWPLMGGINFFGTTDQQWTAEIIWDLAEMKYKGQPLQSGHTYRTEVVLHDGDKDGDIGEACVTIKLP